MHNHWLPLRRVGTRAAHHGEPESSGRGRALGCMLFLYVRRLQGLVSLQSVGRRSRAHCEDGTPQRRMQARVTSFRQRRKVR